MKGDPVKLAVGIVVLALIGWFALEVVLPLAFGLLGLLAWPLLLVLAGAGVLIGVRRLLR